MRLSPSFLLLPMLCATAGTLAAVLAFEALRRSPGSALNRWVAAASAAYVVWVLTSGVAYAVGGQGVTPELRIALVAYIAVQPLTLGAVAVFTGLSTRTTLLLLSPFLVTCGFEAVQATTGVWLLAGQKLTAWGYAGIPSQEPFWWQLNVFQGVAGSLLGLGLLLRGMYRAKTKRLRRSLQWYVGLSVAASLVTGWTTGLVWLTWGLPDPSAVAGLLAVLANFFLMVRYRHLSPAVPAPDAIVPALPDLVILATLEGRVLRISDRLAQLLNLPEPWTGRPVTDLLPGWESGTTRLTFRGASFTVERSEVNDRFGDPHAVLLRLLPDDALSAVGLQFGLSPREKEVANLVVAGLSTDAVAELLFISPATVKNHLHKIFAKTGTANRVQLVRLLSS